MLECNIISRDSLENAKKKERKKKKKLHHQVDLPELGLPLVGTRNVISITIKRTIVLPNSAFS